MQCLHRVVIVALPETALLIKTFLQSPPCVSLAALVMFELPIFFAIEHCLLTSMFHGLCKSEKKEVRNGIFDFFSQLHPMLKTKGKRRRRAQIR